MKTILKAVEAVVEAVDTAVEVVDMEADTEAVEEEVGIERTSCFHSTPEDSILPLFPNDLNRWRWTW